MRGNCSGTGSLSMESVGSVCCLLMMPHQTYYTMVAHVVRNAPLVQVNTASCEVLVNAAPRLTPPSTNFLITAKLYKAPIGLLAHSLPPVSVWGLQVCSSSNHLTCTSQPFLYCILS